jgi:integrative and conjugative element protein (TIGR02256 family)
MKEVSVGSYTLFLGKELIEILFSYRQVDISAHESGGILLGQMKDNSIYLLRGSAPNAKDISHRTGFTRHKEVAQSIIDYEFLNSGKKTIYLGEWHTHPENDPSPSIQDSKMINDQFKKNVLNEDFIVLLIVGNMSVYIGVLDNDTYRNLNVKWSDLR